jgi:hypothetical protein
MSLGWPQSNITDVIIRRANLNIEERSAEDIGRRWTLASQGERPQKKIIC